MAKSNNNKTQLVAKQHTIEGKTEVRVPKHDASPKTKPKQPGRGWEIVNHSPIPADPIVGDPNAPENIIQGKRMRKAVNLHKTQESDPLILNHTYFAKLSFILLLIIWSIVIMVRTKTILSRPFPPSRIRDKTTSKRRSTAAFSAIADDEDDNKSDTMPATLHKYRPQSTKRKRCTHDSDGAEENEQNCLDNDSENEDHLFTKRVTRSTLKKRPRQQNQTQQQQEQTSIHPTTSSKRTTRSPNSKSAVGPSNNPLSSSILPYLDLLRPYMAFQLSLANLQGPAYDFARASMFCLVDAVDQVKRDVDEGRRGSRVQEERKRGKRKTGVGKESGEEEEEEEEENAVLPRKLAQLAEQTKLRLEVERKRKKMLGRRGCAVSSSSDSSSNPDTDTDTDAETGANDRRSCYPYSEQEQKDKDKREKKNNNNSRRRKYS
ncbi:hypothetical protein TW65_00095 [Stemphylium lycopersici]|nr:hypothetical protein TW65_00095 [Stemphylium lycopersici]